MIRGTASPSRSRRSSGGCSSSTARAPRAGGERIRADRARICNTPICTGNLIWSLMAQSFTTSNQKCANERQSEQRRRRVLVTGAAGNIGSYFAQHSHDRYALVLMVHHSDDKKKTDPIKGFGQVVTGDIGDLERMKQLCEGIDTVVHLAANPSPSATWDSILPDNIVGTYNTFVAARSAGCRRVIYASSIHAVSGYPPDVQVKT